MEFPEGATPLSSEDLEGLIPLIQNREELNEYEQTNIRSARLWALKSNKLKSGLLDVINLQLLHKKMFCDVWKWAGKFRVVQTNIGVEPYSIQTELKQLVDDTKFWVEHETYPILEIAVRFHHRLVFIHPFPNGNGRHSRISADLLLHYSSQTNLKLTWGGSSLSNKSSIRSSYIAALKRADKHDYNDLIEFSQS